MEPSNPEEPSHIEQTISLIEPSSPKESVSRIESSSSKESSSPMNSSNPIEPASLAEPSSPKKLNEADVEAELSEETLPELPNGPPPMKHRDTTDSILSTDSDLSATSDVHPHDETAVHGDRSDTGSEDDITEEPSQPLPLVEKKPVTQIPEDDDLPPFVPPDEELVNRIVNQVEFYFSDVNITKDAFLLKHVKRNREGYVSLKLISSFKRVKHIARDWRVVAYALRRSTKLEVNEAGTKLRRKDPLPAYDQTTPSRTVVAVDLPLDKPTIESVAELFRPCGDIALVRILRPGNPIPADVRAFVARHPEMHGVVSALVEFVRTESALNAVARPPADVAVLALNGPAGTSPSPVDTSERVRRKTQPRRHILGRYETDYSSSEAELEQRLLALAAQRRGSTPMDCSKHWAQRRYSRDSGCEDMGFHRRMSAGWESGGSGSNTASDYASRSRSNSGASIPEFLARRMSTGWESGSGSESCCSGKSSRSNSFLMDGPTRRFSYGKDSDSDGYGSFRSRRSSAGSDVGSGLNRRMSDGFSDCCGPRRHAPPHVLLEQQLARRVAAMGLGDAHGHDHCACHCRMAPPPPVSHHHHHPLECFGRRSSSGSFPILERKPSFGDQRRPGNLGSGHMPENVTRMPRGPDGGRGFLAPRRENDIPEVC